MASLGQELKRAREDRGVTLRDIANSTHIGVRFLQAIENDSYDILPGGVFNRAFVRKFAKQVGYDEEQAVKLYDEQLEEMGGEPARRYYTGLDDLDAKPTSGNGLLISLVAMIILAAGAYVAYSYFNSPKKEGDQNNNQGAGPATPTPQPTATPTSEASPTPDAARAIRVQLVAGGSQCWIRAQVDGASPEEATLQPGDAREFNANQKIVFDLGNLPALRISINGRALNVAKLLPNQKGVVAKNVVISKETYQQFVD